MKKKTPSLTSKVEDKSEISISDSIVSISTMKDLNKTNSDPSIRTDKDSSLKKKDLSPGVNILIHFFSLVEV